VILTKCVDVKIINHNIKHYNNLGYDVKCGDVINIPVKHLTKGSHYKVKIKCDDCGKIKIIKYNYYNQRKNINKYLCSKCVKKVGNNDIVGIYGVENVSQSNAVKQKKKETNLKNWGVENVFQSEKIKKKSKKTFLKKYGVENFVKTDQYKKQVKITNLKKYGVENPMQNGIIKLKSINNSKLKRKETTLKLYKNIGIVNVDENGMYEFKCDNSCEHNFIISRHLLYNRIKLNSTLCTKCNPVNVKNSGYEIQLLNIIKENYNKEIKSNKRNIIPPLELDIYLPDLKLAFEFNGLYWHNEEHKPNDYHLNKTEKCEKQGIQLIHIWEDNWIYKQDIVKSMILNKLGKTPYKIYGRKTEIKEITDNKLIREFLETNHLQGFIGGKVKLGLFFENELVSLMTFGKRRVAMGKKSTNDNEYELLRFCNKLNTNVLGGASKLFKYFKNNYKPKEITTYADRSHSNGGLYKQLGFKFISKTSPNYYYIIDGIRKHRFNFRKDKLIKEGFEPNKTEHQIMIDRNIFRIYDSGNLKYKK
jgi:very-short-patch-repair endonuclease